MSANALTLFQNNALPPAHLAAFDDVENVLPRDTTPQLTFRGKTWRLRQGGEEIVLTRKNTEGEVEPAPVVRLVVLNMNQKRSRTFYAGAYVEGQNQQPACWSSDGEKPDKDVPAPFAPTCASCPNSVKGSKITANQKETTACSSVKRVAVIPSGKLDMEPLLLKIPQTSMWDKNNAEAEAQGYFAWDQYVDFLRQRGVKHTAAVVTKVKFDPNTAYPKLLFTAERWLEAAEVAAIVPMVTSDAVQKLLTGSIADGATESAAPAAAAPPATAPAKPVAAAPAPAPVAPPAAAPLAAKPALADDDGGDAFANVGTPGAAAAPTAAPKPPTRAAAAPKAPAPPAAAPAAPKPPVTPPAAASSPDLAALAAQWDD